MVPVLQQALGLADEVLDEVGHALDNPDGAESSLVERGARESVGQDSSLEHASQPKLTKTDFLADVGVGRAEQLLDLVGQVARHLLGCDVGERRERKADGVHVGVVHVAASRDQLESVS